MEQFNKEEFELRGRIPTLVSLSEKEEIDKITSRVEAQVSWLAQLLGHVGPNYWARNKLTLQEKRAIIKGTFGIYDRLNKTYEERTFPENRSQVLVSGDRKFLIKNELVRDDFCGLAGLDAFIDAGTYDNNTLPDAEIDEGIYDNTFDCEIDEGIYDAVIEPEVFEGRLQTISTVFDKDCPDLRYKEHYLYQNSEYIFSGRVSVSENQPSVFEYDCELDETRIVFDNIGVVKIEEAWFQIIPWVDNSDWQDKDELFEGL